MRKIGASSTLTVYHDGQFWVGAFERVENEKLSVCICHWSIRMRCWLTLKKEAIPRNIIVTR